jgi:ubiquinone/menaquinone biosynthesis C-methylase UbiE
MTIEEAAPRGTVIELQSYWVRLASKWQGHSPHSNIPLIHLARRRRGSELDRQEAYMHDAPQENFVSDEERVSKKWGKFARDREQGKTVHRLFALQHPVVSRFIKDSYLNDFSSPLEYVKSFLPKVPSSPCLEIGCGIGMLARSMITSGVCSELDAFDLSEDVIAVAKRKTEQEEIKGIHFHVGDANTLELPENKYQLIYMSQSIHHVENLENLFNQINKALQPGGIFYGSDYIGPTRMQWSEKQLDIMNEILAILPERYLRHSQHNYEVKARINRIPIETFLRVDPSEGVRSEEILPLAQKILDVIDIRPMGGTINYELLRGRIHNFDDQSDTDNTILRLICLLEKIMIREGVLESDFVRFVARKRP